MTAATTDRPGRTIATTVTAGAENALTRLWRGLCDLPRESVAYLIDADGHADVEASPDGDSTSKAKIVHRQSKEERRANAVAFVGMSAAWCTGGWMALPTLPTVFAYAAVVLAMGGSCAVAWKGKGKNGWVWPVRLGLVLAMSIVSEWLHLLAGVPVKAMVGVYAVLALVVIYLGSRDGTWDEEFGKVDDVDEVTPATGTGGAIAYALALSLWGERNGAKMMAKDSPDRGKIRTVGGDLTWDSRRVWKSITFQLTGKTVDDVIRAKEALAGYLAIPADWLIVDVGANHSQVVLHIAETDPWPRTPTIWTGLHAPVHDVWAAEQVADDLLGATPFAFPVVQSSILVAASSGAGKTALIRMLGLIIAGDPRAQIDVWDFKGDGALKAFAPVCETYRAGSEDKDVEAFRAFLRSARRDLDRRKKLLDSLSDAESPDAKITRELAHRTDIDLRPRFIIVDEVQEAFEDDNLRDEIVKDLRHLAKQGRSGGIRLILATQKPDADSLPSSIRSVLPTRIALRTDDYQTSDMILGTSKYRANELPPIGGVAIAKLAGDGGAVMGIHRVRFHYVDKEQATPAIERIIAMRKASGAMPKDGLPEAPQILVDLDRLLSASERRGRMPSEEVAAAMVAYGHLPKDLPVEERKTELANLLRPHNVRPRPDSGNRESKNIRSYWLDKIDQRGHQVGVRPALEKYAPLLPAATGDRSTPATTPVPGGAPLLRVVNAP